MVRVVPIAGAATPRPAGGPVPAITTSLGGPVGATYTQTATVAIVTAVGAAEADATVADASSRSAGHGAVVPAAAGAAGVTVTGAAAVAATYVVCGNLKCAPTVKPGQVQME